MQTAASNQSMNQHLPVLKKSKKPSIKEKVLNNFIKQLQKAFGAVVSPSNGAKVFGKTQCNRRTPNEKQNDSNNTTKDLQSKDQDKKHNKEDTTNKNQQVTSENQQSEGFNDLENQLIKQGVDHQDKKLEQIIKSNFQSQFLKLIPQIKQILQETKETNNSKTQQSIPKHSQKQKSQIHYISVNEFNQKFDILQQEMKSANQEMRSINQIIIQSQQNPTLNKEILQEIIQQKIQENNHKVKQLVIQQNNKILTKINQNSQLLTNRLNEINITYNNFITQNKLSFDKLSHQINLCKQYFISDRNLLQQKIDYQISSFKTQINKNIEQTKNLFEKKIKEIQTNQLQNHVLSKIILLIKNLLTKSSQLKGLKCLSNQNLKQDNSAQSKILEQLRVFLNYNTNLNNVLQKRSTKRDEESCLIREYNMIVNRVKVYEDVNNSLLSHQSHQKLEQSIYNSQMLDLTHGNFKDSRLNENINIKNVQNHRKDDNTNNQLEKLDLSSIHSVYGDENGNVSNSEKNLQKLFQSEEDNTCQIQQDFSHQNQKANFVGKDNLFEQKTYSKPIKRKNRHFDNNLSKNICSGHLQRKSAQEYNKKPTQHKKCYSNKSFTSHKKQQSSQQIHQSKKKILTQQLHLQQRTSYSESHVEEAQNSDMNILTSVTNNSNKSHVSSQLEQANNIDSDKQKQKTPNILIQSLVEQFQSSRKSLSEIFADLKLLPEYKDFLKMIGSYQRLDKQNCQQNLKSQNELQQRRQVLRRDKLDLKQNKDLLRGFNTSRGSQQFNDSEQNSLIDSLVNFADKLDPPDIFLRNLVNDLILTFQNYLTAYQQSQQETQQENLNEMDQSLSQLPQCEHNPIQIDQDFYSDPSKEKQGKTPFESNKKNPP